MRIQMQREDESIHRGNHRKEKATNIGQGDLGTWLRNSGWGRRPGIACQSSRLTTHWYNQLVDKDLWVACRVLRSTIGRIVGYGIHESKPPACRWQQIEASETSQSKAAQGVVLEPLKDATGQALPNNDRLKKIDLWIRLVVERISSPLWWLVEQQV